MNTLIHQNPQFREKRGSDDVRQQAVGEAIILMAMARQLIAWTG
jgi:hypothetical protein